MTYEILDDGRAIQRRPGMGVAHCRIVIASAGRWVPSDGFGLRASFGRPAAKCIPSFDPVREAGARTNNALLTQALIAHPPLRSARTLRRLRR